MATYGYLRVSTDHQCLENQRSEILRFAHSHELVIDKWVSETISGTVKGSGRKLGRLIKRLKKGDIIVVSELSRLSRTMLDIMYIMKTLIEKKVKIYSTKEALAARKEMGMVLRRRTGYCPKMRTLESNRESVLLSRKNGARIGSLCVQIINGRGQRYIARPRPFSYRLQTLALPVIVEGGGHGGWRKQKAPEATGR